MLSEQGLAALRPTQRDRGMRALWGALWITLLLPLCVAPARLPTALPADSVSSETAFLEDRVMAVGDTLELTCDLDDPSQPIAWFKDGAGLLPSNRTRLGQRMLRIINVSHDNAGVYSCRHAHSHTLLSNHTIRVTDSLTSGDDEDYDEDPGDAEAPYWTRPDRMDKKLLAIPAANTVKFRCAASGNPTPSIHWLKNGREFKGEQRMGGIKSGPSGWWPPRPVAPDGTRQLHTEITPRPNGVELLMLLMTGVQRRNSCWRPAVIRPTPGAPWGVACFKTQRSWGPTAKRVF